MRMRLTRGRVLLALVVGIATLGVLAGPASAASSWKDPNNRFGIGLHCKKPPKTDGPVTRICIYERKPGTPTTPRPGAGGPIVCQAIGCPKPTPVVTTPSTIPTSSTIVKPIPPKPSCPPLPNAAKTGEAKSAMVMCPLAR